MSSETSKHHKHKERRHKSRSRSRSLERKKHKKETLSHHHVKTEKLTPERTIKKERHSPSRSHSHRTEDRSSHRHRDDEKPSHRHREDDRLSHRHRENDRPSHRHRDEDGHSHGHRADRDRYRHERQKNNEKREEGRRKRRHEQVDDSRFTYGKPEQESKEAPIAEEDKAKPDYGLSGKLADDTNTYRGIVVKYNEPPEARKPKLKWRLYPFKGEQAMPVLHIHRQSGYLLGRDRKVADIPIDHPSCSKQHAVLQFRSIEYTKDDGTRGRRTRPYIIDLGSANGTFVNNKQIESQRYVELIEKDTIKFGFSSRDYVILHDNVDVSPEEGAGD